jgi:hypothetical protein
MLYLNSRLGKGASLHATLSFDAFLVAFNALTPSIADKFKQGLSGNLVGVEYDGNRGRTAEYVRAMLIPEIVSAPADGSRAKNSRALDILSDSPWLPDGVVRVEFNGSGDDKAQKQPEARVISGHYLKKSYLKKFYEKSRTLK